MIMYNEEVKDGIVFGDSPEAEYAWYWVVFRGSDKKFAAKMTKELAKILLHIPHIEILTEVLTEVNIEDN